MPVLVCAVETVVGGGRVVASALIGLPPSSASTFTSGATGALVALLLPCECGQKYRHYFTF